jgi:hypothetical protein
MSLSLPSQTDPAYEWPEVCCCQGNHSSGKKDRIVCAIKAFCNAVFTAKVPINSMETNVVDEFFNEYKCLKKKRALTFTTEPSPREKHLLSEGQSFDYFLQKRSRKRPPCCSGCSDLACPGVDKEELFYYVQDQM